MATSRDVSLNVRVGTTGGESLKTLRDDVRALGETGGDAAPEFQRLAAELDAAGTATQRFRETETALRAEVTAQKAAIASAEDGIKRLKLTTDDAGRATDEFKAKIRAEQLTIVDSRAALRDRNEALSAAAAASRQAAQAEQQIIAQAQAAAAAYRQTGTAATTAGEAQTVANQKVAASVGELKGQLDTLRNIAGLALGGSLVGGLAKEVAQTADEFNGLQARIKLATGEGNAFKAAFQGVYEIAQRNGVALADVGSLFTKLAQAGKALNVGNQDVLQLVDSITQATQIGGASVEASTAAITQFTQAIASGVLRGDELNSIFEQAPRLVKALADGLGVTTGELRKLGEAGLLTSAQVIGALQGQSAALQAEFDQLPPTVGRAITSLSNNWEVYVGQVDKATGASSTAAKAISALGNNLDTIGKLLYEAGKAGAALIAINLAKVFFDKAKAIDLAAVSIGKETAAVALNTEAVALNTAAQRVNAAATTATGAAGAAAATTVGARVGQIGGAISGLVSGVAKIAGVGLVIGAVVSGVSLLVDAFKAAGTAIGETAAKLAGVKDRGDEIERTFVADAKAARAMAAMTAELAQKLQIASEKSLGLTDQSRKLVGEFTDTVTKGGEVSKALADITKSLQLGNLDGIRNAGTALDVLALKGKISAAQIRDAFADALKGEDLNVFRINALAAFDQSEQGARRLAAAIDAIGIESLRRAGTSVDELKTGFSALSTSAINDVDALAETLTRLELKGDDASRALGTALDKALAAASTERAVRAVIDRFEELGKQGLIAGELLTDGLEKARKKLDEIKPGINSLAEAFRTFGLQTQEVAKASADKFAAAYTQLSTSGKASLTDLRKAFDQWATAAIAANNGVEPYAVKVQRAMLDIKEAALGAGTASEDAGNKTTKAFKAAADQINATAGSLDALTTAANRNASVKSVLGTNQYDKAGNALDSKGNLLQIGAQAVVGANQYFDKAAYDRDAATAKVVLNPQSYVKTKGATGLEQAAAQAALYASIAAKNPTGRVEGGSVYGTGPGAWPSNKHQASTRSP